MMMNMFNMFDPTTSSVLNLNWFTLFLPLIFLPKNNFYSNNRILYMMNKISSFISSEMKNNLYKYIYKTMILLLCYFYMIFFMNYLSIHPFIFSPTSHMSISMYFSIPFWLSLMMQGWVKSYNDMFTHLVPTGTPVFLSPFMVLIETISNLIRPLTLAIRLSANLIAGHILLFLMSNLLNLNQLSFFMASWILNLLLTLEISVAVIQSYVYITLLSLYLKEI